MERIHRATIIRKDKFISIKTDNFNEGMNVSEELTWLPKNIHAIQWYGDEGIIEYVNSYQETIYSIQPYYNYMIDSINKEKELIQKERHESWLDFIESPIAYFRSRRNGLLLQSDWTQMPDSPLTESKKIEWRAYRQLLRDLPAEVTDYMAYMKDTTLWPEPPQ